ncbi:hypothetical protein [Methanolapillus millepedarum]|uniref:Uncharacterized protein n=1 Tax=Methanolapillus millepedarum TaxID=3028296 RepID=A0AA96ZVL4_9EURY|nr:hypothetical protein MsAc7_11180 [Methanosarcinaceae archaeon Ac7]
MRFNLEKILFVCFFLLIFSISIASASFPSSPVLEIDTGGTYQLGLYVPCIIKITTSEPVILEGSGKHVESVSILCDAGENGVHLTLKNVSYSTKSSNDYLFDSEYYSALYFVSGNNQLILSGNNIIKTEFKENTFRFKGGAGIGVPEGSFLEISEVKGGVGSLSVYGETGGSGIGGGSGVEYLSSDEAVINDDGNAGTIVIRSGSITSYGGVSGSGIGTGSYGNSGNISILGGNVMAVGGDGGSGIGCGFSGSGSNISIFGGMVTASGQKGGAGIGGGAVKSSTNNSGQLHIFSGVILDSVLAENAGEIILSNSSCYWGDGSKIGSGGNWSGPDPGVVHLENLWFGKKEETNAGIPYELQNITYLEDDQTLTLTYTVNNGMNDAVLPTIEQINENFEASFSPIKSLRWVDESEETYFPNSKFTKTNENGINLSAVSKNGFWDWLKSIFLIGRKHSF